MKSPAIACRALHFTREKTGGVAPIAATATQSRCAHFIADFVKHSIGETEQRFSVADGA
jgi:hypothetical protein